MKQKRRTLEELNLIDDFLFFEAVAGEKDIEILCKWVKLAARAESPSDFEKKM